jgi:hypothetical protein
MFLFGLLLAACHWELDAVEIPWYLLVDSQIVGKAALPGVHVVMTR